MARIKNVSGADRTLLWEHGLVVKAGQTVAVEADQVYAYTCQDGVWEPADKAARAAHDKAAAATQAAAPRPRRTGTQRWGTAWLQRDDSAGSAGDTTTAGSDPR